MSKKKPAVKKSLGQIEVTANVDFLQASVASLAKDISGLRYLIGDLATRLAILESRPTQTAKQPASWWRTFLLGADSDAG